MSSELPALTADLQSLLDTSPDAVLIVDRAGEVIALNRRAETLFATAAEQLLGKSVDTLLPPRLRATHAAARSAYGAAPTTRAMSARPGLMALRGDGTEFPVEISLTPVIGSGDGLVMAVVHEAARDLGKAPWDQGGAALDAMPDAVLTTDTGGNVAFLNRSAERLTGWSDEAARGRPLREVLPLRREPGGDPLDSPVTRCLGGLPAESCEAVLGAGPDHEVRILDVSTTPIRNESGAITGAAVVARDITAARRIAQRLTHQATHDPLTGLVNRSEFERRLIRAVAGAEKEQAEHALCFLDLDGFKRVNDACGHLAGDELLRQLTELMRDRMRSRDTLARLGGDEFGMILEHCQWPKAGRIAEGIVKAIRAHRFSCRGRTHTVGASIGIVAVRAGEIAIDLLRAADDACYLAKRSGGNRVQLAGQGRQTGPRPERDWSRRILAAIEQNRLLVHAQPLKSLRGGTGCGPRLELLLRLDLGAGKPLLPGRFLPVARRHGVMPRVDAWVIRHAIERLARWRRDHPGVEEPRVAINLSEETVLASDSLDTIRQELARSGVRPSALCFEFSESLLAAHPVSGGRFLSDIRDAGCQTTLEHCGVGMTAFTTLRRLHVDYLKIAGHLVRSLSHDPVDRALATALNEVGHALCRGTIGVEAETDEALDWLTRLGVDHAQGYRIGYPEPFDTALARLVVA